MKAILPSVRFDSLEQEAFLSMWRAYDGLRAIEEDFFARYDLTAQQYNALRVLEAVNPESMPTLGIAKRLVTRAPDITRLVDKLEQRALVTRERLEENRRVVRIAITVKGKELLEEIAAPLRDCHERQLGHMRASDLRMLIELLRKAGKPHEPTDTIWR